MAVSDDSFGVHLVITLLAHFNKLLSNARRNKELLLEGSVRAIIKYFIAKADDLKMEEVVPLVLLNK